MALRLRHALLATSALLAPTAALAQAPDGGRVVAGQAGISQSANRTSVIQGSNRAVVEWRRFDVGPGHTVDIRQPGASSWSLQRVTGGDPSAVAGRVTSNGGVAIVNPAGIVFHGGAQVDVAALIATTSDTTNAAFMSGRMAFDGAPRPGARVENRGGITVAEGGLAALVAPGVANSGTIRARLGRVALAGGEAFALDLAGDGLLSIDVTRGVTVAPGGSTALVTNSGTIEAAGGGVTLTARAASGLLETLVEAGGRISAPGGRIEATASGGGVRLPDGALLDTSGGAPGGAVTVGAGARSRPGAPDRLSARATVERGATVRTGRGGTAIVHSESRTAMHGSVEAPGGAIEVSSRGALALDGRMDAPGGSVLVDPVELRIVDTLSGGTEPAEITAAAVNATTGRLTLQADRRIRVDARVTKPVGPLTLETTAPTAAPGDGIHIARPLTVTGDLLLRSAGDVTQAPGGAGISAGTLEARSSAGAVRLDAGDNAIRSLAGGSAATRFDLATRTALSVDGAVTAPAMRISTEGRLTLHAPLSASGALELVALRGISQAAGGAGISAGLLSIEAPLSAVILDGAGNRIARLGDVSAPFGLTLANETGLDIAGQVSAGHTMLTAASGDLTQAPGSALLVSGLGAFAPAGSVLLEEAGNAIPLLHGAARDGFAVGTGGALRLSAPVSAGYVALRAGGDIAQDPGAAVSAGRLLALSGGAVVLDDPGNAVASLGESIAASSFLLSTTGTLRLDGPLAAPAVTLVAGAITQAEGGRIATGLLRANALFGDVALDGAGNAVAALGAGGAAGEFRLATTGALVVADALDAGGTIRLDAASLRLLAPLDAPSARLRAREGDIVGEAGRIAAARLSADAAGEVRLDAAGNAIAAVSGRAGRAFRIATTGDLRVEGVAAPEVALAAGGSITGGTAPVETDRLSLSAGGRVDLRAGANAIRALGAVSAPRGLLLSTGTSLLLTAPVTAGVVELAAGDIAQLPGAPLSAASLRLSAGGTVALEATGNSIPRRLGATAGGDIRIAVAEGLAVEAAVHAGGVLALQAGGDLTQALAGAGLVATRLEARSLSGGVALSGSGNRIAELGPSGAAAGFALAHEGGGALRLAGLLAAPELSLVLPAGMVGAGGALRTDALRLAAGGAVLLDGPGHRVAAIGGRATGLMLAGEGALVVVEALDVSGRLALSAGSLAFLAPVAATGGGLLVATGGDISQAASGAGLRIAGGLEAHAAGTVALAGAGNALPRLLGGSAGGGFAVATTGTTTVSGEFAGETVALRAGGTMTLDGVTWRAGRAVLVAAPGGLEAGTRSRVEALDPTRHPVLVIDTRRAGGLSAIPDFITADIPGRPAGAQPTQLGAFGAASGAAAGPAAFDIAAGASPVFLLIDGGSAVGQVDAARFGLLARGGSAFLVGALAGTGGEGAAPLVAVTSAGAGYLFNGCHMGSPVCAALAGPPPAPPARPDPPAPPTAGPPTAGPPPREPEAPRPAARLPVEDALNRPPAAPASAFPRPVAWPLPALVEEE